LITDVSVESFTSFVYIPFYTEHENTNTLTLSFII